MNDCKQDNMSVVKDRIMYQATTYDYHIGDKINFGDGRNYQAERVFGKKFVLNDGSSFLEFVMNKTKRNQKFSKKEMKMVAEFICDYEFCLREIAIERCRLEHFKNYPSRMKGMWLVDDIEKAKAFLTTAKSKQNISAPKVVAVKLNGKLLRTSWNFNPRGGFSIDEYTENAKKYFTGVDEFYDKNFVEYLFEGVAEIVDVIE